MNLQSRKVNYKLKPATLLSFTKDLFLAPNLENTYVLCTQHVLPTTHTFIKTLVSLGLKKENLSIIGKCYSTNPETYLQMLADDIHVCPSSLAFDPYKHYDRQFKKNIKHFAAQALENLNTCDRLIVLDDGGYLLSQLNKNPPPHIKIIGVEQTSSGYHKLKKEKLHFPVINVARSAAKLIYESPIIAESVLQRVYFLIDQLPIKPKRILIIGNGAIGSSLAQELGQNYDVSAYDVKKSRSNLSTPEFLAQLPTFDIIIGCTGKKVLNSTHYSKIKKNALLISASSSDREFNAKELRLKTEYIKDCHQNLLYNGKFYLFNCGFPINFDNNYDAVDNEEFFFTRSLLLTGVLQAQTMKQSENTFIDLDFEAQREIVKKYLEVYPWRIQSHETHDYSNHKPLV